MGTSFILHYDPLDPVWQMYFNLITAPLCRVRPVEFYFVVGLFLCGLACKAMVWHDMEVIPAHFGMVLKKLRLVCGTCVSESGVDINHLKSQLTAKDETIRKLIQEVELAKTQYALAVSSKQQSQPQPPRSPVLNESTPDSFRKIANHQIELHPTVRELQRANGELRRKVAAIQKDKIELMRQISQLTAEKNDATFKNSELIIKINDIVSKLEVVTVEREELVNENAMLFDEKENAITEAAEFSAQLDEVTAERDAVTAKVAEVIAERDTLAGENETLVSEYQAICAENEQLAGCYMELRGELETVANHRDSLLAENAEIEEEEDEEEEEERRGRSPTVRQFRNDTGATHRKPVIFVAQNTEALKSQLERCKNDPEWKKNVFLRTAYQQLLKHNEGMAEELRFRRSIAPHRACPDNQAQDAPPSLSGCLDPSSSSRTITRQVSPAESNPHYTV